MTRYVLFPAFAAGWLWECVCIAWWHGRAVRLGALCRGRPPQ